MSGTEKTTINNINHNHHKQQSLLMTGEWRERYRACESAVSRTWAFSEISEHK